MIRRVVSIVNARLPTEKAQGYQACQMAQAFLERGVEVTVVCPRRFNAHAGARLEEFYDLRRDLAVERLSTLDLMPVVERAPLLRRSTRLRGVSSTLQTVAFSVFCRRYLAGRAARDLAVYLRDPRLAHLLVQFAPRGREARFVLEVHGLSTSRLGRALEDRTFASVDGIVAVTGQIADRIVARGVDRDRVLVAHDGVDLDRFGAPGDVRHAREELGLPLDRTLATWVGNFHTMGREKGIPEVIRAAGNLLDAFPQLDFHFVGGPLDRVPAYRSLIAGLGLPARRFVFRERQPVRRIPLFLAASDLLLMPFPWTEHYAHHMSPLKLFEYMSAGRPIVASRLPSITEVLDDGRNAVLCEPGSAESLAASIGRALETPGLAARIARRAREDVERYTWNARAGRILEFVSREEAPACP